MTGILIIKEVEYAIQILDALYHKSPMSAAALSQEKNIPSPFIYRVLKKLETGGLLTIRRGPKGGYSLRRDCEEITLYDVVSAFENTFLVIECMNAGLDCRMHRELGRIQGLLKNEFRSKSLASMFDD